MQKKKSTKAPIPHAVTTGQALSLLLGDLKQARELVNAKSEALMKAGAEKRTAEDAALIATGKVALFMQEQGVTRARCDGLLIDLREDCVSIQEDPYADLSK